MTVGCFALVLLASPAFAEEPTEEQWVQYLSWRRCACQKQADEALAVIDREKRKAKSAGVVDLRTLNDAAEALEDSRFCVREAERAMRETFNRRPMSCNSRAVKETAACMASDDVSPRCEGLRFADALVSGPPQP
jgi:hypothetical protein